MGLDRYDASQLASPKYKEVIKAYTMTPIDQVVRATANTASGSYIITLPPVALAKGKWYSVLAHIANSTAVTVTHHADSEQWDGDLTLDTDGDRALLFSDGMCWNKITSIT